MSPIDQRTTNSDLVVDRSLDALRWELPKLRFNHILEEGLTMAFTEGRAEPLVLDPDSTILLVEGNDLGLEIVDSRFSLCLGCLSCYILLVDREELLSDEDIGDGVVGGLSHFSCFLSFSGLLFMVYAVNYIKASCSWQLLDSAHLRVFLHVLRHLGVELLGKSLELFKLSLRKWGLVPECFEKGEAVAEGGGGRVGGFCVVFHADNYIKDA